MQDPMGPHSRLAEFRNKVGATQCSRVSPDAVWGQCCLSLRAGSRRRDACPPRAQIVVGVLVKYVNLAKGWRHRLFVLQNGVLRYFKARAPWEVPIGALLASSARRCGRRSSCAHAVLPKAAAVPDAVPARRCSAPRASTCTRCWRACGSRATWCSSARRRVLRRTSGYGAPALGLSASCARARGCTALDWEARAPPPARQPSSTLQCCRGTFQACFDGHAYHLDRQRRAAQRLLPWPPLAKKLVMGSRAARRSGSLVLTASLLSHGQLQQCRARNLVSQPWPPDTCAGRPGSGFPPTAAVSRRCL